MYVCLCVRACVCVFSFFVYVLLLFLVSIYWCVFKFRWSWQLLSIPWQSAFRILVNNNFFASDWLYIPHDKTLYTLGYLRPEFPWHSKTYIYMTLQRINTLSLRSTTIAFFSQALFYNQVLRTITVNFKPILSWSSPIRDIFIFTLGEIKSILRKWHWSHI
jgi:hypothetical protein